MGSYKAVPVKVKSCCTVSRNLLAEVKESNHAAVDTNGPELVMADMVQIPAGEFVLGSDDEESSVEDGETVRRRVKLDAYYMDKYAVSNEQFARFINDTGYETDAQKYGWSFVFHLFVHDVDSKDIVGIPQDTPWWIGVQGASWKNPEGRSSTISERLNHPVTHVSWNDAKAYAKWAGKRLPTEAEWEYAAASGVIDRKYPWGNELHQDERHHCNIWQGEFPHTNSEKDGYLGTAPVDSYEPNEYGLYNMSGNVWEWSEDTFSYDPSESAQGFLDPTVKLIKGGSYLCHQSYCNRYRLSARTFNTSDSSTGHMGFRCVSF
ncbi:Serine/threonine-protein kinase pkn1 [compost metagenome]